MIKSLHNSLFEYLKTLKGRCSYICLWKLCKRCKKDEDFMLRFMMSQQILGRIYS